MAIVADDIATGSLTSGGTFTANPSTVTVSYPGGERPPVTIDMADITGVRRDGLEVTLIRKGNRESGLKVTTLDDASALETLVRRVVISRQNVLFELEVLRLHDHGFRLRAATPGMAQMVKPKTFSFTTATALLIIGVVAAALAVEFASSTTDEYSPFVVLGFVPAIIYVFLYLSIREQTALVVLESTGQVMTYRG